MWFKDVKSTATNDDQYFVFEDLLYQVRFQIARSLKSVCLNNSLQKSQNIFFLFSGFIVFHSRYKSIKTLWPNVSITTQILHKR